jgi:hypothetical protein
MIKWPLLSPCAHQDHGLDAGLDIHLIPQCKAALPNPPNTTAEPVYLEMEVQNTHRWVDGLGVLSVGQSLKWRDARLLRQAWSDQWDNRTLLKEALWISLCHNRICWRL